MDTVTAMLDSNLRRVPGYWVQLALATGIATLGLALDSTAVVIGGMLVSPLMGPIVTLGMGFTVGSSLLVLRAAIHVAMSVFGVIAAAALITLLLPFHEVTAEIAARTSPTLLDLLIAVLCALAATYTTVRQTGDTTAAAAGTAIGIALVPPLCVVGFGIGAGTVSIASGAMLLFIANFCAILTFSVAGFLVLGYARVDAVAVEHRFTDLAQGATTDLARRVHGGLGRLFGSQYGVAMRLLVPAVFLLIVYVPLRQALDDVVRQVRMRDVVRRALSAESPAAMQTSLVIDRDRVAVRLVIVGTVGEARRIEAAITRRLEQAGAARPDVGVIAVPDAGAMAAEIAAVARPGAGQPTRFEPDAVRRQVANVLLRAWPASAGTLATWNLDVSAAGAMVLTVRHIGAPLGPDGEASLARDVATAVGGPVRIRDVSLPIDPLVSADAALDARWLAGAVALMADVEPAPTLRVCVKGPVDAAGGGRSEASAAVSTLEGTPVGRQGRLEVRPSPRWSIHAAPSCD